MKNSPGGRRRWWRARRCSSDASAHRSAGPSIGQAQPTPGGPSRATAGEAVATAMQAAIALITASLDSPELEAQALPVIIPQDTDGLGDLMAGLHLISELLIHELHEATGEPPLATLQRLAILAEHRRGMPSAS
jgi:hypothetical protein